MKLTKYLCRVLTIKDMCQMMVYFRKGSVKSCNKKEDIKKDYNKEDGDN